MWYQVYINHFEIFHNFLLNLSLSDIIAASIFDLLLLFCFSTIKNHKTEIYVLKFQHGHRIKLYKKTKLQSVLLNLESKVKF